MWWSRRGRLNKAVRTQAARARTRFMDAEARGDDPYQATSRRINAIRSPVKLNGLRVFLRQLEAERPHEIEQIRDLLSQIDELAPPPAAPVRAKGGGLDFDRIATGLDLSRVAAALGPPASAGQTPVPSVLLAKTYKSQDPTCYWMSEKLDGVRAIWDGQTFWSRSGNEFVAPEWFRAAMPQGAVLDGELFAGRGQFRDTVSAVRRKIPNDRQWQQIRYLAFDLPLDSSPFERRHERLRKLVSTARSPYIEAVQQRVCVRRADLDAFHREIAQAGGEGVMLRLKGSLYEPKRSSTLLKVKEFVDEEARIVGYQKGTGKHAGRLGAYHAELLSSGERFKVGTGLTDQQRESPLPKGTVITVRYFELTPDGKPRFPAFVGARDYE